MSFFLPFISIALLLAALILALDSIWRVENRLDRFLKYLFVALVFLMLRKGLAVFGFDQFVGWARVMESLDISASLFFLFAFAKMFAIVRSLNHEGSRR